MVLFYLQISLYGFFLFLCPIFAAEKTLDSQDNTDYIPYEGQRYNALDWNLLKALAAREHGNVLISPLSIKMVLAMVYEGASGATEKEIEQVLNLPSSKTETREKFKEIIEALMKISTEYTLDIGCRIYMDSSIQPQQRFEAALKAFYSTDIKSVNFTDVSTTRDEINYWVSNITHGYVQNLVNDEDIKDVSLLLTNALYFKGLWRTPFLRNNTRQGVFYTDTKSTTQVPYMFNYGKYYYSESAELDAKILRLPFKGSHASMFILLPNSKAGLSRLIKDINVQVLRRHIWLMDIHDVHVHLPKFAFNFSSKLGRILQMLGLNHIFQNTASLAGIARGKGTQKRLMVSNILQKAGIEINEEGSTVYAATELTLTNKFGEHEYIFNASNPFMFYIEDENSGTVLFAGKIENPLQKTQPAFKEELNTPSRFADLSNNTTDTPPAITNAPRQGERKLDNI